MLGCLQQVCLCVCACLALLPASSHQMSLWPCRPQAMCSVTLLAACAYPNCCLCLSTAPAGQAGSSNAIGKTSALGSLCCSNGHPGSGKAVTAMTCCQHAAQRPGLACVHGCNTNLKPCPLRQSCDCVTTWWHSMSLKSVNTCCAAGCQSPHWPSAATMLLLSQLARTAASADWMWRLSTGEHCMKEEPQELSSCVCIVEPVSSTMKRKGDVVGHGSTFRVDIYSYNLGGCSKSIA